MARCCHVAAHTQPSSLSKMHKALWHNWDVCSKSMEKIGKVAQWCTMFSSTGSWPSSPRAQRWLVHSSHEHQPCKQLQSSFRLVEAIQAGHLQTESFWFPSRYIMYYIYTHTCLGNHIIWYHIISFCIRYIYIYTSYISKKSNNHDTSHYIYMILM